MFHKHLLSSHVVDHMLIHWIDLMMGQVVDLLMQFLTDPVVHIKICVTCYASGLSETRKYLFEFIICR